MARTSRKQQKTSLSQPLSEQTKYYDTAIYARLSVEDNGKESDSLESQIEYLEEYIASHPSLRKAAIFTDNGYTGTNFMRPDFSRMIDAVRRGDINCVIVKDLSRLGRNYVETGEFLEKVCPFLGLRFISVNDNYDSAEPSTASIPKKRPSAIFAGCLESRIRTSTIFLPTRSWICSFPSPCSLWTS